MATTRLVSLLSIYCEGSVIELTCYSYYVMELQALLVGIFLSP